MASKLIDKDHGWKHIKKEIRKMDKAHVKVGLQQNGGSHNGTTLAMIGFWNEFGTSNIPERPFIRTTADQRRQAYANIAAREADKIIQGKSTVFRSLSMLGQVAESDVKKKITSIRIPPNAASTIRKKGSDNPLIDTGRMRASVRYIVKGA